MIDISNQFGEREVQKNFKYAIADAADDKVILKNGCIKILDGNDWEMVICEIETSRTEANAIEIIY